MAWELPAAQFTKASTHGKTAQRTIVFDKDFVMKKQEVLKSSQKHLKKTIS